MTSAPIVVEVPGSRSDAINIMVRNGLTGLPVIRASDGKLMGVVSRRDVFRKFDEDQLSLIMKKGCITVTPDTPIEEAAEIFSRMRIHRLPVVDNGNLVGIVDRNKQLMTSFSEDSVKLEPYADKWRAFGWNVVEINGNDMEQVVDALDSLPPVDSGVPTLIVANTVKGNGVSFMEKQVKWHCGSLTPQDMERALADVTAAHAKEMEGV